METNQIEMPEDDYTSAWMAETVRMIATNYRLWERKRGLPSTNSWGTGFVYGEAEPVLRGRAKSNRSAKLKGSKTTWYANAESAGVCAKCRVSARDEGRCVCAPCAKLTADQARAKYQAKKLSRPESATRLASNSPE